MATQVTEGIQILDDGEYYVELNVNFPSAEAPGLLAAPLLRRRDDARRLRMRRRLRAQPARLLGSVDRRSLRPGDRQRQPLPRKASQPARRDRGAVGGASACSLPAQGRPLRIAQAMTMHGSCVARSSPPRALR